MIVIRLMGGLGNQMFQYALGRNLSLKYNKKLYLDISSFDTDPLRIYDLDIFKNINGVVGKFNQGVKIQEPHYHFSESILNLHPDGNYYLSGYWQSEKYFKNIENVIRNDFEFKNKIEKNSSLLKQIKSTNSVLINVRRTDYLNTNFHGVLGNEYIMKGVDIIKSKVENPHYFIFSDDIEWCKDNIKLDNMTIVDHSYKGYKFDQYLQLMIECKHFIIPNSSFAWWAAWLNTNNDKVVIAPIKWFNASLNTNDLVLKKWIRI